MATQPKRPGDGDNVVSLREARARQAAAQAGPAKNKPGVVTREKKMPVLVIFFGLLAILVAYKFLLG